MHINSILQVAFVDLAALERCDIKENKGNISVLRRIVTVCNTVSFSFWVIMGFQVQAQDVSPTVNRRTSGAWSFSLFSDSQYECLFVLCMDWLLIWTKAAPYISDCTSMHQDKAMTLPVFSWVEEINNAWVSPTVCSTGVLINTAREKSTKQKMFLYHMLFAWKRDKKLRSSG